MNSSTEKNAPSYEWKIKTDAFGDATNPFGEEPRKERKFNIKIRQKDLELLDALAETNGVSRSALVNYLLLDGLTKELISEEDHSTTDGYNDLEIKMLIANRADNKLSSMSFQPQRFWQEDVVHHKTCYEINEILNKEYSYIETYEEIPLEQRHSDKFNELNSFFKGIDNK